MSREKSWCYNIENVQQLVVVQKKANRILGITRKGAGNRRENTETALTLSNACLKYFYQSLSISEMEALEWGKVLFITFVSLLYRMNSVYWNLATLESSSDDGEGKGKSGKYSVNKCCGVAE